MTTSSQTTNHYLNLPDDTTTTIFYRTAGSPTNPTLLLLHGFPSSSHQFRNLIPLLSSHYHVIAPDFPGFGFTTTAATYTHTFANLATTTSSFLSALQITSFSMYIFDYGAPVGLRLALSLPSGSIRALITQNGNAYEEGIGEPFAPLRKYWASNSAADREALRTGFLSFETTKAQYDLGEPAPELTAPESYTLDFALMGTRERQEALLDLFKDYETNLQLYPKFQEWLRSERVPTLVAWGRNDPFFVKAGAEAYKKDVPDAEMHLLDAGHFACETHTEEIGRLMLAFLEKHL